MRVLLDLPKDERPTAVIAFNDIIAVGALHAVRGHGLGVPQDISVVGVDDIALAAHTYPPLTTISQPKYQMGKLAVQTLCRMREGRISMSNNCTLLETPLIVRESTAPCPI
jgi:LacI family transcriptional regulator